MTISVSVRLPAGLVQRLDEVVDAGSDASRAAVIGRALEREFRRLAAVADVELLLDAASAPRVEADGAEDAPRPRRALAE